MAKLSRDDVLKLARLARLRLSDSEVEAYRKDLSAILEYVAHLDSADTTGLEPTYQVTGLTNVARLDVIKNYGATPDELLKNVPQREGNLIKVRRMIG